VASKSQIKALENVTENDEKLLGHMMKTVAMIAKEKGLQDGYRTVMNNGKHGC
jgi:histidine triad (HIT) family protein